MIKKPNSKNIHETAREVIKCLLTEPGKSLRQIARDCDCHYNTARKIFRAYFPGQEPPGRQECDTRKKLRDLKIQGYSHAKVAEELGLTVPSVCYHWRRIRGESCFEGKLRSHR